MTRIARLVVPEVAHHVTQRGMRECRGLSVLCLLADAAQRIQDENRPVNENSKLTIVVDHG